MLEADIYLPCFKMGTWLINPSIGTSTGISVEVWFHVIHPLRVDFFIVYEDWLRK